MKKTKEYVREQRIFKKYSSYVVVSLLFLGILFALGMYVCKPAFATFCDGKGSMVTSKVEESIQLGERYFSFTPLMVQQAASQNKKVVLYFYAPWCVTCTSLDKEFTQSTAVIPEDVIVLRLEYDSNSELKTRYGVTLPHTFVYIDQSGNTIQQWVGDDVELLSASTR